MTKVYVVTHQTWIYPEGGDVEFKDLMLDNWSTSGVFTTMKRAQTFIHKESKRDALEWCEAFEDEKYIARYNDSKDHFDIEAFELDEMIPIF